MQDRRFFALITSILLLLTTPLVIKARQASPGEPQSNASVVTPIATARPLADLLPDRLGGVKAAAAVKEYSGETLGELVAEKAAAYQEYLVVRAASRQYGGIRVDLFETANTFAAFGLFTYNRGPADGKSVSQEIGFGGARTEGELVFWKDKYFVRVMNADKKMARAQAQLARALSDEIVPQNAEVARPPLVESLPAGPRISNSERYFLGPESLEGYVERRTFEFSGDAEAVLAEYDAAINSPATTPAGPSSQQPRARVKLVIVEYHTPHFAYDAMARLNDYVAALPADEQSRIIVKREGNYIVQALGVEDREAAASLIEAVKYPYGVKWLRDPRLPSNDPFRIQKAGQMLLSTFILLGLLLLTVLVVGGIAGASIFLKRRKQQREIFSNAGGMLRLDIDPFEATLLGLPPRRSNED